MSGFKVPFFVGRYSMKLVMTLTLIIFETSLFTHDNNKIKFTEQGFVVRTDIFFKNKNLAPANAIVRFLKTV